MTARKGTDSFTTSESFISEEKHISLVDEIFNEFKSIDDKWKIVKGVSTEELIAVEQFVNARIQENIKLEENRNIPYQKALDNGAIALFGEKYGDSVRTIQFGKSFELCGGTHVKNTSDIWHFKIISEGAVASGIRRIEAITGDAVKSYFEEQSELLGNVNSLLKQNQDPVRAIKSLQSENAHLKKEILELSKLKVKMLRDEIKSKITEIEGVSFIAEEVDLDAQGMKDLSFDLGGSLDQSIIILGSKKSGKALLSCYISKSLVNEQQKDAGKIIRNLGRHIQGGGGGQAFYASAGGKNPKGISDALATAKQVCFH